MKIIGSPRVRWVIAPAWTPEGPDPRLLVVAGVLAPSRAASILVFDSRATLQRMLIVDADKRPVRICMFCHENKRLRRRVCLGQEVKKDTWIYRTSSIATAGIEMVSTAR